jgi:hypothetical protein
MTLITIHPRQYYIGTTSDRTGLTLPADAVGAHFFDTDVVAEYIWTGSAWQLIGAGAVMVSKCARLRSGVVTEYNDPDDAISNSDTSGDIILVPPGTWVCTQAHSVPSGVSIFGINGPAEKCVLQCSTDVGQNFIVMWSGVAYNVRFEYTRAGSAVAFFAFTGSTLIEVQGDATVSSGTGTAEGLRINTSNARNCQGYAAAPGGGNAYGWQVFGGYCEIWFCYGYGVLTSSGSGTCCGMAIPSISNRLLSCIMEAGGSYGSRYGAIVDATSYAFHCVFEGTTASVNLIDAGDILYVYSCAYTTTSGSGSVVALAGDRAGLARNEVVSGSWSFSQAVALVAGAYLSGGNLDLNAQALIQDADGDTSLTAGVDDEVVAKVGGTDKFRWTSVGLLGVSSSKPRLGTSSPDADKWGRIYLADGEDVYPRKDDLGCHQRFFGRLNFNWHFDDLSALPSGFSWAGTPFITPATVTFTESSINLYHTSSGRAFLYRSYSGSGNYQYLVPAANPNTIGVYYGLRYDDGSDNNFVEFRVSLISDWPGTWQFSVESTIGGTPQASVTGPSCSIPLAFFIGTQIGGTKWSNWTFYGKAYPCLGIFSYQIYWMCRKMSLAFTPTRSGIITNFVGTSWHRYVYDAYHES